MKYSMYTKAGDNRIEEIVQQAKVLKMTWPQVLDELRDLANESPEDFGEATDTSVRECVYDALGFDTEFYVKRIDK